MQSVGEVSNVPHPLERLGNGRIPRFSILSARTSGSSAEIARGIPSTHLHTRRVIGANPFTADRLGKMRQVHRRRECLFR